MEQDTAIGKPNTCWQCRQPAEPGTACDLVLVSPAKQNLDPMDFAARTQNWRREVRVAVPRCRRCRWRGWTSVATILLSAAFGAAISRCLSAGFQTDSGNEAGLVIMTLFIVATMLSEARNRRRLGLRPMEYPPIVALRRIGWSWKSD